MPGGHCLLVGVGGSGRRCAATLASFICEATLVGVELSKSYGVTEWRDDLKRILKEAGTGAVPVVFLFADTQMKWEGMLEDINGLLNSGEVPGLFPADERAELCEKVSPMAKAAGLGKDLSPAELFAYFVERVKRNLHIVLAMSPIGDAFRDRLRKFPSLVNCCTIDWFTSWPEDALVAVGIQTVKPLKLDEESQAAVVTACQHFHQSAVALSEEYLAQARRFTYVTPTNYTELLMAYRNTLAAKRDEVSKARSRYVVGLEKLAFATSQVETMEIELVALQPVLRVSQAETAELKKALEAALPGVMETRKVVGADTAVAEEEAAKVGTVKKDCQADLDAALPILANALTALDTITPGDLNIIKSFPKPPENVRMVMGAVCVMLGEKPEKVADPAGGSKKVDDFWGVSKRLLGEMGFLQKLKGYDKDNIEEKRIEKVRKEFLVLPNFKPEIVAGSSSAAEGMCKWVCAMDSYERVIKVVEPKKKALAEAEATLAVTMASLKVKQDALAKVEGELASLQGKLDDANKKEADLVFQVDLCQKKLERASQLIGGLGGEKVRWSAAAERLGKDLTALTGDALLASGIMSYLGAYTAEFRRRCLEDWSRVCVENKIPCTVKAPPEGAASPGGEGGEGGGEGGGEEAAEEEGAGGKGFQLAAIVGDPILIRAWQIDGLPTDSFSTDNGIIVTQSRRWPLMIDPQGQANKWVRAMEKVNNVIVAKQTDPGFLRTMENAIQFGRPVLLENVGEELEPALEPVLLKIVFKQGGVNVIRLGEATVEYDERFKLYITTKLRNPHYLPEVSSKVTLVNFMITPDGLTDQLLGIVTSQERPDLEEEKNKLILQSADSKRQLAELENKILHVLSSSSGNILEDETAINVLNSSKVLSDDISAKQAVAAATEAAIDQTRAGYLPVAQHTSRLLFCVSDLGAIDPMYQYSMNWYVRLFVGSIQGSKKSDDLQARIKNILDHFTFSIFRNVCRSLFEKDKLLFAFLLAIAILSGKGEVDMAEYMFLLTGGTASSEAVPPNPGTGWLPDKNWAELVRASQLSALEGLHQDFAASAAAWKKLFDSEAPQKVDMPGKWGAMGFLTRMQKLVILRCLRPDKVILGMQDFVGAALGPKFLTPPPFDLKGCYEDSTPGQPLIFVLSPGSDPMASLLYFAEGLKVTVNAISLGQGQGPIAEAWIEKARAEGGWVVLQNCHLATSWMTTLERIAEQLGLAEAAVALQAKNGTPIPPEVGKPPAANFRLWLTAYPSPAFPVSVLQDGVKMTNEPPKGLRSNLKRSFLNDPISDAKFYNSVANADLFRRLLLALTFFHGVAQERRQYGPLGFNIPYEFNESDIRISIMQVGMFLDDPEHSAGGSADRDAAVRAVPFKHLRYLVGE
jgi:dynein heavy chain